MTDKVRHKTFISYRYAYQEEVDASIKTLTTSVTYSLRGLSAATRPWKN